MRAVGRFASGRRRLAPQDDADAYGQFVHVERLGHVVLGAEVQALDAVDVVAGGAEHDDRRPARLGEAPANRQAVFAGHHRIEHDQVDRRRFQHGVHGAAAVGLQHTKTVARQAGLQQFADVLGVVDDKEGGTRLRLTHIQAGTFAALWARMFSANRSKR